MQIRLNRISANYPAIPKVPAVDGIFGSRTEASVKSFQEIFDLTPDGMIVPEEIAEIVDFFLTHRGNAVIDEISVHRLGKEPFLI